MKTIKLFCIVSSILITLCFIRCESNEENMCITYFLDEFNMKPYNGEDLDCKTYIRLYEFEKTLFTLMNNHCADFAPFTVFDCNGEEFCFTSIGPCHIQESIDQGIIGIEK